MATPSLTCITLVGVYRDALAQYRDDEVVLVVDAYDIVICANFQEILSRFVDTGCQVVFASEVFCWPFQHLASAYPPVSHPYRFLNAGAVIGYAGRLRDIMSYRPIDDSEDEQVQHDAATVQH